MNSDNQRGLKPWKKGQSGNPKGRPPKEKCLVTMIEQYLCFTVEQLKAEVAKPSTDVAHRLAIKYILDCHEHPEHANKLMDRLYGQPKQSIEATGKDGGPIEHSIDAKGKLLDELNRFIARTGAGEGDKKAQ